MSNPQPFRISRTAKLTLATATTLLLGVVAIFLLAAPPRPAEAIGFPGTQSLAPTVSVSKSSVVVDEGRTATNTGGYGDLVDLDADTVRVSASVGTVTQGSTVTGTWYWSYATPHVPATETKTVTITATDSTGRSSTKSFSLTVVDHGLVQPKVMAYNIGEGKVGQGGLQAVASTISTLNPDIVLLNEVRMYDGFGARYVSRPNGVYDQTKWLAEQTGFPYYKYHRTAYTGITGSKGVAILSQYSLSRTEYIPVMYQGQPASLGTLRATIEIDGLTHDVFSTRFPPAQRAPGEPGYDSTDRPKNEAGHKQAIDIVRSIPSDHAVIFGGDLNASWSGSPWAAEFRDNSGLTDALVERPDPEVGEDLDKRADYIYYRGPYSVYQTQHRRSETLGLPEASDHPYVFAHFLRDY